ncbi:putative transmembrane protein [Senna tora]|uniref:Putative transmembrane protein n=1 Tax=Senna tora TaxID=362788 RepID=A0A834WHP4_9FABA|nr:putative transmembrane protein [Senna tora]
MDSALYAANSFISMMSQSTCFRMDYQYFGRLQRPKGTNMKQTLLVMFLLAVCSWVVYQINHSNSKPENNHGAKPKLVEQLGTVSLGRKGKLPSWLDDERGFPNSGNGDERSRKISESDSQSIEKEAEILQLRVPPNDGSIKDDEDVKESEIVADGDWTHSFHDENGVPPEVNETEPIGSSEAHMEMVIEEHKSDNSKEKNE